jgi:hypothetical protein
MPRPPHAAIVESNTALVARLGIAPEEAALTCWACRCVGSSKPSRAHVVAASHGGSNEPDNFFLLCDHCHLEQPDGAPREAQLEWLFSAPSGAIVDQMRAAVCSAGAGLGLTKEASDLFWGAVDRDELGRVISAGYRDAAGLQNGRANAFNNVVTLFKMWATKETP